MTSRPLPPWLPHSVLELWQRAIITSRDDKSYELKVDPTFYAMGGYKFRFRNPQYAVATDDA